MIASPTISVVIPNYNHGRYLREAIDSVVRQSRPALEIIVIDDASTDDSVEIARAYARDHPFVRLVAHAQNRGVIENVNAILPHLAGTHALFLAADDQILPGYFETVMALLEKHPSAGMCLCDFECIWDDGDRDVRRQRLAREPSYFSPAEVPRVLYNRWPHGQSVVQLAALRAEGGYPADLRWHCDWFASWTICARHGFCYVPMVGTVLRVSDSSYSGQGRRGEHQRQVLQHVLQRLQRPEFAWLAPLFREANAFSHFGLVVLRVLLSSPEGRHFVTWRLLLTLGWKCLYTPAARVVPRPLKRWLKRRVLKC